MSNDLGCRMFVLLLAIVVFASPANSQDAKDKYQSEIPSGDVAKFSDARLKRIAGNSDQAITILADVVKRNPNFFSAQYNLGLAYLNKKQNDDGIAALEKAAALKRSIPSITDASIFNSLGWAYMLKGDYVNAEASLKEGERNVDLLSDDSKRRLYTNTGWLYMNTGRFNEAEKYLKKVNDKYDSKFARENLKIIEEVKSQRKTQPDSK